MTAVELLAKLKEVEEDHLTPTPQARHSAGIRMIDFHLFSISNVKEL
jgi:hypothetical protein